MIGTPIQARDRVQWAHDSLFDLVRKLGASQPRDPALVEAVIARHSEYERACVALTEAEHREKLRVRHKHRKAKKQRERHAPRTPLARTLKVPSPGSAEEPETIDVEIAGV